MPSMKSKRSLFSLSRLRGWRGKPTYIELHSLHSKSSENLITARPSRATSRYSTNTASYPRPAPRFSNQATAVRLRYLQEVRMAAQGKFDEEERKSFGIGGAGNIRRPSEVIYPVRLNEDGTRRSSVWSTISSGSGGKRASFLGCFGRKGSFERGFREVDPGDLKDHRS